MAFMTKGVGVGTDEAGAAGSVVTAATSGAGCAAGTSVGIAGGVTEVSEGLAGSHAIGSPHKPNITLIKPLANRTATEIKATMHGEERAWRWLFWHVSGFLQPELNQLARVNWLWRRGVVVV